MSQCPILETCDGEKKTWLNLPWAIRSKKYSEITLKKNLQCCSVVPCCCPRDGARPVSPKERPWWEHRNLSERIERANGDKFLKRMFLLGLTLCNDIQWCHDRSRNMQKCGMDWYGTEYGLVRTCLPSTTRSSNSHRTSQRLHLP